MNCAILGAGGWGTTIATVLFNNGHNVTLWEYDKQYSELLFNKRVNELFLPGFRIAEDIFITNDLEQAVSDKHFIVIAVPSQFIRSVLIRIDYERIKKAIIVNLSKGIEINSLKRVSEVILDVYPDFDDNRIVTISGPSHAEEVSRKIPTALVAASHSLETARFIRAEFMNPYFRVYSTDDLIGVELGGSLKNIIAIAAGLSDGAGLGDNTKAALMTRGIAEISRLGVAMGARPETFSGLSGIGDVIVTCMSKHSRNRFVGIEIGKGKTLNQVLSEMKMVAEGVDTSKSVYFLSQKFNIETPICNEIYKVLFEDKNPLMATTDLMTRDAKEEIWL